MIDMPRLLPVSYTHLDVYKRQGEICAKANCSRGYECTVEVTQCLIPPCPAIGKCVKINPCSTKVCPNDTNCITDPSDDTNALCVFRNDKVSYS